MSFEVLIASKGRPKCPTAELLCKGGQREFRILVEPQEQAAYEEAWPGRTIKLPSDNEGLWYVRQFALDALADKSREQDWYWMLDDDITGFHETLGGKCFTMKAEVCLRMAEKLILDHETKHGPVGMAGLEYQQFAWRQTKSVIRGGYCDVAVAINRRAVGPEYDPNLSLKVDRDFTVQMMSAGYEVIRLGKLAFSAPENGSNAGGLQADYRKELLELREVETMVQKWGDQVCQHVVKPNGRHDVRINWAALKGKS